jgi:hypothetical protein
VPQVRTGVPGTKTMGRPGFPARGTTKIHVCAFIKESRMKFANANEPDRKSGGSPFQSFCKFWESIRNNSFSAQVRWCEPGAPVPCLCGVLALENPNMLVSVPSATRQVLSPAASGETTAVQRGNMIAHHRVILDLAFLLCLFLFVLKPQ